MINFIAGLVTGVVIVFIINWLYKKDAKKIANELISSNELQNKQDIETIISRIKDSFGELSFQALSKSTSEFLKLANETLSKQTQSGEKTLEGKKELIDQNLKNMKDTLQKVQDMITNFEKDREQKFGELSNQLKLTAEQTGKLQETTHQLRSALASTKTRGQWGERMAEDVLRLFGFIEGINYLKQKALETVSKRPDYTFLLPQGLKVNMDVKFPLDNYLHYLEVEGETDKERYKSQFLRDVKNRVKEVTTRDYINPAENTVDYVIVFIPNEQVYAFINQNDSSILDEALRNKVILCSPVTLYAILAVIRQAVDNFNLEKTSAQILSLLGAFYKQWNAFLESLEKMGKRIEEAQKEFNNLTTTRKNQLEKPLRQIEDIRRQKGITETPILEVNVESIEEVVSPKVQNQLFN
ncbi:MAG: DNA recombination protein RmuC [bacterium]|nr:DNA recombination protein RmuC [bacterium]